MRAALRSGKLALSVGPRPRERGRASFLKDALSSDGYVPFDDGQSSPFGFELN